MTDPCMRFYALFEGGSEVDGAATSNGLAVGATRLMANAIKAGKAATEQLRYI